MTETEKRHEIAGIEFKLGNARRHRETLRKSELWRPWPAKRADESIAELEAKLAELKAQ